MRRHVLHELELGFDYLRDNMAMSLEDRVQRGHEYAIVDEVDSILIDEARTPHIISGRVADAAKTYVQFAAIVRSLVRNTDYEVDEKKKQISVTESGMDKVEAALGVDNIYDDPSANWVHHLNAALRAKELYKRDVDYLVADGEVKIIDEFTGRILEGRRWSEGLHQAVEAKERVKIKEENQTLATTTLQNYFRLYKKLAGMTGTAETEAVSSTAPTSSPWSRSRRTARWSARTTATSSSSRRRASSTPSSTTSSSATRPASRCSSARSASRRASTSPSCWSRRASRTPC